MNIKEITELTTYLNTLSKDDQCSISIGACYDGYIFVEDTDCDGCLNGDSMIKMGYIIVQDNPIWWALEGELPA